MQTPRQDTMRAWSALLVGHRRLTAELDAELRSGAGLSLDEYDVLYQLRTAGEPVRMSELADRVLISRPTTTRVVDRLVARGWVERQRDDGDRRVVRVALTDEGRRAQRVAGRMHLDGITRLFESRLRPDRMASLADALDEVTAEPAQPRPH